MTSQEQHNRDKQFLIESLSMELILMLMEDRGLSLEDAMELLYNSETFKKIEDERTGLYYQGAVYVLDFLNEELALQASEPQVPYKKE